MNLLGPVSDIMTINPITLSPSATIEHAINIFEEYKIHHIPVAIDNVLLGMVSMSDFLAFRKGLLKENDHLDDMKLNNYQVKQIMTQGISTMHSKECINVALGIFNENIFHSIPIVDDDLLVGIVTTHDIISNLAKDGEAYAEYD